MTVRLLLWAVIALTLAVTCRASHTRAEQRQVTARVTWYGWTGNRMTSGLWPYEGAAGCSEDIPLGTWIELDNRRLQCLDMGHLEPTHIDIFCATPECARWAESMWPTATVVE